MKMKKFNEFINESTGQPTFADFVKLTKDLDHKVLKSSLDSKTKEFAVQAGVDLFNSTGTNFTFDYGNAKAIVSSTKDFLHGIQKAEGVAFPGEIGNFTKSLEEVAEKSEFVKQYLDLVASISTHCVLLNQAITSQYSKEPYISIATEFKNRFHIGDAIK